MSVVDILPGALAVAITVLLIFGLIWLSGKSKVRKEVDFLRPRDKRGERLDVTHETDRSVLCEKANPIHRFIKVGPAFTFKNGGKTSTKFYGIEGSAYTAQLKQEELVKISVVDFLKTLWGKDLYEHMPAKMKDAVEKDKIGITIEPVKINPEEHGLDKLSSDDVNDEGDAVVLNRLAKQGMAENVKQKLLGNLLWFGLGLGAYAILQNLLGAF